MFHNGSLMQGQDSSPAKSAYPVLSLSYAENISGGFAQNLPQGMAVKAHQAHQAPQDPGGVVHSTILRHDPSSC